MFPISEILKNIKNFKFVGDSNVFVSRPINFDENNLDPTSIMWLSKKNSYKLSRLACGVIVCPDDNYDFEFKPSVSYIITNNPRKLFSDILEKYFLVKPNPVISSNAYIHETVVLGTNVSIGNFVTIHENVVIGNNTYIDDHTVIKSNTIIGSNVFIGCNCTIGGVGFGYEKDDFGNFSLIPHLGNVIIHDFVEIGNNTTIDRAVLGSTLIFENVKIDNLVHIAHGVKIGRNSMIIANSMVAGSVIIGDNVWVAPSGSILNGIEIGENSVIGMGAVVMKSVTDFDVIVGNPGRSIKK